MKTLIKTALILLLTCSCSTPRLTDSIWCTVDPVQNNDQEGLRITSLYLFKDGKVDVYQSVMTDSNLIVAPFLFAKGAFNITGNIKKEAYISISGTDLNHQTFNLSGLIDLKKNSMLLTDNDTTANLYYKYGNLTIKQ